MIRQRTYSVISVILFVLALAATGYFVYCGIMLVTLGGKAYQISYGCVLGAAALCFLILPPDVLVHELGHIVCGTMAGMRFPVVRVGRLEFSRGRVRYRLRPQTDGETAIVPRGAAHMKGRLLFTASGGAAFQLLYAVAVIVLVCTVTPVPAVFFFLLYVPSAIYGAVTALLPAELGAGRTDGGVIYGIVTRDAETDVALRVLTAQGILSRGGYCDIPESLLFSAPAVREDSAAFKALLFLRYSYARACGDTVRAEEAYARLCLIADYLSEEEREYLKREKDALEKEKDPTDGSGS